MEKIDDSIVNGYNLKTDKDNNIGFSESYIDCYRQYLGFIRSDPWGHSHPPGIGNDHISQKLLES